MYLLKVTICVCLGELGQHLDSIAIATDFQQQKVISLTLSHALQLAAFFQGNGRSMTQNSATSCYYELRWRGGVVV